MISMSGRLATWNVNSIRVRLPYVLDFLTRMRPDVLALQETKVTNDLFPFEPFETLGYHVTCNGEKQYNGVAFLTASPFKRQSVGLTQMGARYLEIETDALGVGINVYVPNGQSVGSAAYQQKLDWLDALCDRIEKVRPDWVMGDFNIAPTDDDVYDTSIWHGDQILCTQAERQRLNRLQSLGYQDVFRGTRHQFTWWNYQMRAFQRGWGLRIDHIWVRSGLAYHHACVDIESRKGIQPSDHAPVRVDIGSSV